VAIAPINFGVGDHRAFIIIFLASIILRELFILLCCIDTRRLIICQPSIVSNYIFQDKKSFNQYRIKEKISKLQSSWNDIDLDLRAATLSKIYNQATELLLSSEKKYQKL